MDAMKMLSVIGEAMENLDCSEGVTVDQILSYAKTQRLQNYQTVTKSRLQKALKLAEESGLVENVCDKIINICDTSGGRKPECPPKPKESCSSSRHRSMKRRHSSSCKKKRSSLKSRKSRPHKKSCLKKKRSKSSYRSGRRGSHRRHSDKKRGRSSCSKHKSAKRKSSKCSKRKSRKPGC